MFSLYKPFFNVMPYKTFFNVWAERHSSFEFDEAWFKNCLIYFIVFTGNSYKIWFNWSAFNFYCFWIFDRVLNWWGICKLELHCAFLCSCYYSCITNTVSVLLVIVILMTQNLLLWAWIFSTSLFIWPSLCQLSQPENGHDTYFCEVEIFIKDTLWK